MCLKIPNHRHIEIYWIPQSDSESLTHFHGNISSDSIYFHASFSPNYYKASFSSDKTSNRFKLPVQFCFTVFRYCGHYSEFSPPAIGIWLQLVNREHSQPKYPMPSLVISVVQPLSVDSNQVKIPFPVLFFQWQTPFCCYISFCFSRKNLAHWQRLWKWDGRFYSSRKNWLW